VNNLYVTKITAGIVVLEGGLDSLHDQLKEIHQNVNEKIRSRFSDYFDDLVNLKDVTCDLEAITSTEEIPLSPNAVGTSSPIDSLENGFRIVLKEIPSIEKQHRLSDRQCTYDCIGVQSLSGGQQALLGLALVFSCALSGQRSPVYFLDEVCVGIMLHDLKVIFEVDIV
jgi:chromosome segregation ATPase